MEKTYIDPIFHMEKEERLYDLTFYFDIDQLDRISELNFLNGVDGLYNKQEALYILNRYLPGEYEWVKEVKHPHIVINDIDERLGKLYGYSQTRLLSDFELEKFIELVSEYTDTNIQSIILDSSTNKMYIPYEEVMGLFEKTNNFSFLKGELLGHEMLCAHSMSLAPVELVLLVNEKTYQIQFNQVDFIDKTKSRLEEYSYIFMNKKPNELYKSIKLKLDKKKRKTYVMFDRSNGLYKIGYSKNPERREKTLQSEKPSIELLIIFEGNIEKELHQHFKDKRVRGEWFRLSQDDLFYIGKKMGEKKP